MKYGVCNVCKEYKEFVLRYNKCRDCMNDYWRKYREKNREKIIIRKREKYHEDIEKSRMEHREYYKDNNEYIRNRRNAYNIKRYKDSNIRAEIKDKIKVYKNKNRDKINEKKRIVYKEKNSHILAMKRKWCANNPEKIKEYRKKYRVKSRIRAREYFKENIQCRLKNRVSSAIRRALNDRGSGKAGKSTFKDILPYTINELMSHLESKFKDGMTWENYGEWHVDHIVPDSWFEYSSPNDDGFKQSWDIINLQPLWAFENISKGNRFAGEVN